VYVYVDLEVAAAQATSMSREAICENLKNYKEHVYKEHLQELLQVLDIATMTLL